MEFWTTKIVVATSIPLFQHTLKTKMKTNTKARTNDTETHTFSITRIQRTPKLHIIFT